VSVGGQSLPHAILSGTSSYSMCGVDVSSLAGVVAELRFTANQTPPLGTAVNNLYLDAIAFSSTPLPLLGTVTTSSSPSGGGTTVGGGSYAIGYSVTVWAWANRGYNFLNWTENGTVLSTTNSCMFTVNSNRDLVANFTPVTPTISGYVRASGGAGIIGVTMIGLPGSPTTDSSGYYTATVLYGWSGTVTPGAAGYTFSPSSNSYSNVTGNLTGQDYTGTVVVALPGSVVAWGDNTYGQCNVPGGLTNAIAIAAGFYHTLALKMDGTVVGWGQNDFGQTNPPVGLSNVTEIAAGWGTSFALKRDGTLEEWGWDGGYGLKATAEALTNIISISALWDCGMALKSDNTVFVWGKSTHGETNVPAGLSDVVAVSAGGYFCMALKRDGTVVTWGSNAYGQTNTPTGLNGVKAVAAGGDHCLVLESNGTVVAWGYNAYGQTNVPPDLTNAVAVSAGAYHSLALRADGTLVAWGLGSSGQTNIPPGLRGVTAISAGGYHNLALVAGSFPMQLSGVNYLPSGQVEFTVSGLAGDVYRVLGSTNLRDWQTIASVTNLSGTMQFTDPGSAGYTRRFYRLVMP
jgi:alpha-tubulin suppressor-like RCC1 family protein